MSLDKEKLIETMLELDKDFEARFENIEAIKGKKFVELITFFMKLHGLATILREAPPELKDILGKNLFAAVCESALILGDLSPDDGIEALKFADNIQNSANTHLERVFK